MNAAAVLLQIRQFLQFSSVGPVTHNEKLHILTVHLSEKAYDFFNIVFFGKPSQDEENLLSFTDSILFPDSVSVLIHLLPAYGKETFQTYTRGNYRHRTFHAIGFQQLFYFCGGGNDKIGFLQDKT